MQAIAVYHAPLYSASHQAIGHCNPLPCRLVVVLYPPTCPCLGFRLVRWQKGHPRSATKQGKKQGSTHSIFVRFFLQLLVAVALYVVFRLLPHILSTLTTRNSRWRSCLALASRRSYSAVTVEQQELRHTAVGSWVSEISILLD